MRILTWATSLTMGPSLMEGQTIAALRSRQKVGSFRLAQVNRDMRLLLLQLHSNLRYEEQPEAEPITTNGLVPRDEARTAEPENTSVVCGRNAKRPSALESRKLLRLIQLHITKRHERCPILEHSLILIQ